MKRSGPQMHHIPIARRSEPGGLVAAASVDLVLSFDTTSSMHAVLDTARRCLEPMLRSLFTAANNAATTATSGTAEPLRVGLIVHGDYGDLYETRLVQPSNSATQLAAFLARTPGTCGLDYPECYELVLRQAWSKVKWRPHARRVLVLLGDAVPHEADSKRNKYGLDWRKEARALADAGVEVYCVDCGGVGTGFYAFGRELCDACGGAIVPYRGCKRLERLLMQLLLLSGGGRPGSAREALARQYRGYHCDSQRAETVRTTTTTTKVTSSSTRCQQLAAVPRTTTTTAGQQCDGLVATLASKMAHCASRLLIYLGLIYLTYSVWLSACL